MHAVVSAAVLCASLASSHAAARNRDTENIDVRLAGVQMLENVPREMVNGAYAALSEDAYIRRVDGAHMYFTLQRMVTSGGSKPTADWWLEGFQCDDVDGGAGVCVQFAVADLSEPEVRRPEDEEQLQYVFRQHAVKHRSLQFESGVQPNEAIVGAYYDCAPASGDNWCCSTFLADADTATSGSTCWYLPPDPDFSKDCWLDTRWDGTFVCCGNSGCPQVVEGPVPTSIPTDPPPTANPSPTEATFSPASPPPFQIITAPPGTPPPIPSDAPTTAPPIEAPTTQAPTTVPQTVTPTTAPPTEAPTTTASTQAPTFAPPTEAPMTASPTQAPATNPPTQAPPIEAPTTTPPTEAPTNVPPTESPTNVPPTQAPMIAPTTTAPITSPPTQAPSTAPPTTDPATQAPSIPPTSAPSTTAPTTTPPTQPPTIAPSTSAPGAGPATQSPSSVPPIQAPTAAPTQAPDTNLPTTPTQAPTAVPIATTIPTSTQAPTSLPTSAPTTVPATTAPITTNPIAAPPTAPTQAPIPASDTINPTATPTAAPTTGPTQAPTPATVDSTAVPIATPTTPTQAPSPSQDPSAVPATDPTQVPIAASTQAPAAVSTTNPTQAPTSAPTLDPSPTQAPTEVATAAPTAVATEAPLAASPTEVPTTAVPTDVPAVTSPSQDSNVVPLSDSSTSPTPTDASITTRSGVVPTTPPPTEFLSIVRPTDFPESTTEAPAPVSKTSTPSTETAAPVKLTNSAQLLSPGESKKGVSTQFETPKRDSVGSTNDQASNSSKPVNSTTSFHDSDEIFQKTLAGLTGRAASIVEDAGNTVNVLVVTGVAVNAITGAITAVTAITSGVSAAAGATSAASSGIAASQGLLHGVGGSASAAQRGLSGADFSSLLIMINYLQFLVSGSHLSLPGAPDFFFDFTDSLGWCNFQMSDGSSTSSIASSNTTTGIDAKHSLSSANAGNFSVADGNIISGVLAYAERVNIKPEELFTKTAIAFVSVVGSVAAVVASLYTMLRCMAKRRLELVIQRLNDLPRAKLLVRLLIQSCLSICLMSEYALSMTSSFQLRYNHQNQGDYSAFAFATVALIVICFGLIVLGVIMIWNKSEEKLSDPDFKFAWGAYYKYYHFQHRYFFVAKMGTEILSGVIIGLVSDVPSQLTLLMSLQLAMYLYTVESAPYSMDFQTVCSSTAFVMKMLTYALISSFLTASTEMTLRDFVGTLVILLQVTLLLLFNSRQLYILYKQMKYMWSLRQDRLRAEKESRMMEDSAMLMRTSMSTLAPKLDVTPTSFELAKSKKCAIVATPTTIAAA